MSQLATSAPPLAPPPAPPPASPLASPLLISLSGIAALARVQRPVVSMWRQRFAATPHAFPSPVSAIASRLRFDAAEVAAWLMATGHGKNPDAVLDAPAFADLGIDLGDDTVAAAVDALLAIRACSGSALGDPAAVRGLAMALDPADVALVTELDRLPDSALESTVTAIEMVAEAAFGTRGAKRVFDRHRARRIPPAGADGRLAAPALEMIVDLSIELVAALADDAHGERAIATGVATTLTAELMGTLIEALTEHGREHIDLDLVTPSGGGADARDLIRRAVIAGRLDALDRARSTRTASGVRPARRSPTAVPTVALSRLPDSTPLDQLAALEMHVLEAPASMSMIVIGPASLLVDAATREVRAARGHILRTGRVRGVVRLPAGLVPGAPRHALALWVLAPAHADVPIIDRLAVTADLDGVALGDAVRRDLVGDLVASIGPPRHVRAHAFRFARFTRTASLLAGDGSLVATAHGPGAPPAVGAQVPALIDHHVAGLGEHNPTRHLAIESTGGSAPAATITLGALVEDGDARVLSGTRIGDDQFDAAGFRVFGAELDAGTPRFVDRVRFAVEFPSARLTEPGDVVFVGGERPRAIVDAEGSSVVATPARVLRLADRSLVPEVVAADIAAVRIRLPWRRWPVRRVPLTQADGLRAAMASIAADRAAARRRIAQLDDLESLLTAGVAAGSITLNPLAPPAPTKGAS